MAQICRTCLEEVFDSDFVSLNDKSTNIKDELRVCVPELDLSLIPDASMCVYCANSLHAAYDFKQKCLRSEEKIRSQKKCSEALDLDQIKQEPEFDEQFDVVDGAGIGMEVVFIRDGAEGGGGSRPGNEPVNSFLMCDEDDEEEDEWSPAMISHGTAKAAQRKSIMSNGKPHSINKIKLKNVKKEPQTSLCDLNNTSIRAKQLVHSRNGEKAFKCDVCPYTTPRENLLKVHVRTHSGKKAYNCPKCAYETFYRQCLQNHLKNCNAVDTKKGPKSLKCSQCTFQTSQNQALQEHMRVHSIQTFKCTSCTFEATNLSTFKRHLNIHTAGKVHKCQQCDYQCHDMLMLRKHMSSHKENKSFKCHLCGYSTDYAGALSNHVLTHTGERRYACTLCNYKAIQKGNLKNHMKHHTTKGPYKCLKCSYSAGGTGHLQKHMSKCHGEGTK